MTELNSILLKRIECVACLEYMTKSIFICEAGHSICADCNKLIYKCPKCRRRMTKRRNYHLEAISQKLFYPCEFNAYGCNEFLSITNKQHDNDCSYRPIPCKLTINGRVCTWSGPKCKLKDHAVSGHKDKAWMLTESLDRWRENEDPTNELQLIQAHDEIFYINRAEISSMMYWTVQFIGKPENAKKFGYSVQVQSDHEIREICISEICQDDTKTLGEIIEAGSYIGICVDTLRSFKNNENNVWFKIKIQKFPPE